MEEFKGHRKYVQESQGRLARLENTVNSPHNSRKTVTQEKNAEIEDEKAFYHKELKRAEKSFARIQQFRAQEIYARTNIEIAARSAAKLMKNQEFSINGLPASTPSGNKDGKLFI